MGHSFVPSNVNVKYVKRIIYPVSERVSLWPEINRRYQDESERRRARSIVVRRPDCWSSVAKTEQTLSEFRM